MYLIAIFISPLYFAIKGKWVAFLINSILYGAAVILLITFIGAIAAPFPWLLAAGHAVFDLRTDMIEESAEILATKMAAAMREEPPTKQ